VIGPRRHTPRREEDVGTAGGHEAKWLAQGNLRASESHGSTWAVGHLLTIRLFNSVGKAELMLFKSKSRLPGPAHLLRVTQDMRGSPRSTPGAKTKSPVPES
jgi:hypothetical protein